MPIYEYRCKNGHTIEVMQRMSDDPLSSCTTCKASVQRVFHPVAVHFKGSGFYNTDYGKQNKGGDEAKAKERDDGKPKDGGDSSSKSSSDTSDGKGDSSSTSSTATSSKKSEAKADAAKS